MVSELSMELEVRRLSFIPGLDPDVLRDFWQVTNRLCHLFPHFTNGDNVTYLTEMSGGLIHGCL